MRIEESCPPPLIVTDQDEPAGAEIGAVPLDR